MFGYFIMTQTCLMETKIITVCQYDDKRKIYHSRNIH